MNFAAFMAFIPVLVISSGIVVVMGWTAYKRSNKVCFYISQAFILAALASLLISQDYLSTSVTQLFLLDGMTQLGTMLILLSAAVVTQLSLIYLQKTSEVKDEYCILLLTSVLGALLLVYAQHYVGLFLGLEVMGIGLIGMLAYHRNRNDNIEAGVKYLILNAAAAAIMLMGIALVYAQSGSMAFTASLSGSSAELPLAVSYLAVGLIVVGIGFKLSLVPFHMWTPDVYQGTSTPVTMLLATISKVAVFVVLLKLWFFGGQVKISLLADLLSVLAVASMLVGNILALRQQSIKRLMAYSSIAHMGYLLIAVIVAHGLSRQLAWEAVGYYLFAYVLATLVIFSVFSYLSFSQNQMDVDDITELKAMFWQNPLVAIALVIAFLSLAGIPLTVGFIGKFYLMSAAVQQQAWTLLFALVAGSALGLFYYLRIILSMFAGHDESHGPMKIRSNSLKALLVVVSAAVIVFGIVPDLIYMHISDAGSIMGP